MASDRRRLRARDEHHRAVERFAAAALRLEAPAWTAPWRPGAWSSAEITQHVIQSYEIAERELSGGAGAKPRVGPVVSTVLRWVLLPHVLFHRNLPRAKAPVETDPSGYPGDPSEAIEALRSCAATFEMRVLDPMLPRDRRLRHPYFGPLGPVQALRLLSLHTEHHARQVEVVAARK
jgi:hypothetical protein